MFQSGYHIFAYAIWIVFWLVLPTMAGTLKDDFNDSNLDGWTLSAIVGISNHAKLEIKIGNSRRVSW